MKIGTLEAWEASDSPGAPIIFADDNKSIEIYTHGDEIIGARVYDNGNIIWSWGYLPVEVDS